MFTTFFEKYLFTANCLSARFAMLESLERKKKRVAKSKVLYFLVQKTTFLDIFGTPFFRAEGPIFFYSHFSTFGKGETLKN